MKVSQPELEQLLTLNTLVTKLANLQREQRELSLGKELDVQRESILLTSQEVIQQRSKAEEIQRDIERIAQDLKLVDERIIRDRERLGSSSNAKDITGIQHELETLAKRKDSLETNELELMEQLEQENSILQQLGEHKRRLEELFETASSFNREKLRIVEAEILEVQNNIAKLRVGANPELLAIFDQRAPRGVPIGLLRGSSCGACNMSLTSQDVASLSKIANDELARCPECGAILVRA